VYSEFIFTSYAVSSLLRELMQSTVSFQAGKQVVSHGHINQPFLRVIMPPPP